MARTVNEIFEEMKAEAIRLSTDANNADAIAMFNNTSKFAIWRILFFAIGYCIWSLEKLWDAFQILINSIIANEMPHTLNWYRTKAIAFQYGFPLIADSDKFDNTGFTDQQIGDSKVIKYAAVTETTIDGKRVLQIKIAGKQGDDIVQLDNAVEVAFTAYMQEIKDAGVPIIIYNRVADVIRATVDVYYDALLLDENGNRLDGLGAKPVEEAAKNYPFNLDFNGEFSNAAFIDDIQNAYGVSKRKAFLVSAERQVGAAWQAIPNTFIPEAGYAEFDSITINYHADV